jgi:hypothetical protein
MMPPYRRAPRAVRDQQPEKATTSPPVALQDRVKNLESYARQQLEYEVAVIWERYGHNLQRLRHEASSYEQERVQLLGKLMWPDNLRAFTKECKKFGPFVFNTFFTHHLYPLVLRPDPKAEDSELVQAIDPLHILYVWPEVFDQYTEELHAASPTAHACEATWMSPALRADLAERHRLQEDFKRELREQLNDPFHLIKLGFPKAAAEHASQLAREDTK